MASAVQIGPKGGSASADTLRLAFAKAKAKDEPVRVRLAFQVYTPPASYAGLRDHTVRFMIGSRRDFEKVHAAVVDLLEHMLGQMGYAKVEKPTDTLPDEDAQAAMAMDETQDDAAGE